MDTWTGPAGDAVRLHPVALLAYYGLLTLITWKPVASRISLLLHPVLMPPSVAAAHLRQSLTRLLKRGTVHKGLVVVLVIALVLVWVAVFSLPDGRLNVTFLDVVQGDAILIQTPAGGQHAGAAHAAGD